MAGHRDEREGPGRSGGPGAADPWPGRSRHSARAHQTGNPDHLQGQPGPAARQGPASGPATRAPDSRPGSPTSRRTSRDGQGRDWRLRARAGKPRLPATSPAARIRRRARLDLPVPDLPAAGLAVRPGPLRPLPQGRQNLRLQPRRAVQVPPPDQAAPPLAAHPAGARDVRLDHSGGPCLHSRTRLPCRLAETPRAMGWDNPPVPWREFERRLSWRHVGKPAPGEGERAGAEGERTGADGERERQDAPLARTVTRLPGNPRRIPWAELHCHSSFSFLDGASDPSDLIREAAKLGLSAIAITDHDGMYGVPQFAQAATRFKSSDEGLGCDLATVFGAELSLDIPPVSAAVPARPAADDPPRGTPRAGVPDPVGRHLLVLARDPDGYRRLCQVISTAHLAGGEKGRPAYDLEELARAHDGHWVILTGCRKGTVPAALAREAARAGAGGRDLQPTAVAELRLLTEMFGRDNVMVELINNDQP